MRTASLVTDPATVVANLRRVADEVDRAVDYNYDDHHKCVIGCAARVFGVQSGSLASVVAPFLGAKSIYPDEYEIATQLGQRLCLIMLGPRGHSRESAAAELRRIADDVEAGTLPLG